MYSISYYYDWSTLTLHALDHLQLILQSTLLTPVNQPLFSSFLPSYLQFRRGKHKNCLLRPDIEHVSKATCTYSILKTKWRYEITKFCRDEERDPSLCLLGSSAACGEGEWLREAKKEIADKEQVNWFTLFSETHILYLRSFLFITVSILHTGTSRKSLLYNPSKEK